MDQTTIQGVPGGGVIAKGSFWPIAAFDGIWLATEPMDMLRRYRNRARQSGYLFLCGEAALLLLPVLNANVHGRHKTRNERQRIRSRDLWQEGVHEDLHWVDAA